MHVAFFKDAAHLVGSTTAAKLVSLGLVPVITRLFTPEHFGIVAFVLSFAVIIGNIGALRYDQAIVLPKEDAEAAKLFRLSFLILAGVTVLVVFLCFLIGQVWSQSRQVQEIGGWLYVIPVAVALICSGRILSSWAARVNQFPILGRSEISASLATGISRVAMGFAHGSSVTGLFVGALLGYLGRCLTLGLGLNLSSAWALSKNEKQTCRSLAVKYREFPTYSVPTGFVRGFIQKMPLIMLGIMFTAEVVGLYAMAARITRMPIDIVSGPLRRLYMQRIANLKNSDKPLKGALLKMTSALMLLGLVPFSLVGLYGEPLFAWLLGDQWAMAGYYAMYLIPWLFTLFAAMPSSTNLIVLKKQPLLLRVQLLTGFLGLTGFAFAYLLSMSVELALGIFVIIATFSNLALFGLSYHFTANSDYSRLHKDGR